MKNVSRIVFFVVVTIIIGGAVFLATWDIPANLNIIEEVLPNDRFPR